MYIATISTRFFGVKRVMAKFVLKWRFEDTCNQINWLANVKDILCFYTDITNDAAQCVVSTDCRNIVVVLPKSPVRIHKKSDDLWMDNSGIFQQDAAK